MVASESPGSNSIFQASAIPCRQQGGQLEFCLITSTRDGRWGFPKGIIDPGDTFLETALKEAHEEAGLRGRILGEPLGSYMYKKWGAALTVIVVLMEVTQCEESWQEEKLRQRRWVTPQQAIETVSRKELKRLLRVALDRIGKGPSTIPGPL